MTRKLTFLVVVSALAATTVAQRGGGAGRGRNAIPEPKGNHVVVQVENKLAIVRKSQVSWYKQMLGQQYLEETRQWKEASKAAKKNKVKLETPKPAKKKLKVVNASSKTEEAARKILEALLEKSEKSKRSKVKLEEGNPLGEAAGRGRRRGADRGGAGRGRGGDKKDETGKTDKTDKKGKKDKKDKADR